MEVKQCRKCNKVASLDGFYKHPEMADGRLNVCIECIKSYEKSYREKNIDRIKEYDRNRPNQKERNKKNRVRNLYSNLSEEERKKDTDRKSEWRRKNKAKASAHAKVSRALLSGNLVRPVRCSDCGNETDIQAHHEDYSKPIEVEWLCQPCHKKRHRKY